MENEFITSEIIALIVEKLDLNVHDIKPGLSFTKDLSVDSLDLFELMIEVERKFHITMPGEDADKIATVHDLTQYVIMHVGKPA